MKYRHLNVFMMKPDTVINGFSDLLVLDKDVVPYELDADFGLEGVLYVKRTVEKRPNWGELVDTITGTNVIQIGNKSSSAVLFIKTDTDIFAITFGYGRHLVNLANFAQDFGLKTALNTLNHESLRSVDIHSLEDQPVQK